MPREERIFSISGNNKGLLCPFKLIICLEGYCHQCQIYFDWQKEESSSREGKSGSGEGKTLTK